MIQKIVRNRAAAIAVAFVLTAALLAAVAATAAAYIDTARLNHTLGKGNIFSIQVSNGQNWVEAETEAAALIITTTPSDRLSTSASIDYEAKVRVDPNSPAGNILPSIYMESGCQGTCEELFGNIRFDVSYDGQNIATNVSAGEFNSLGNRTIENSNPGDEHTVKVTLRLTQDTPSSLSGNSTVFGVKFEGMSI